MKANIAMELIIMPTNAMANPNTHPKGVKSNKVWSGFEFIFSDCKVSCYNYDLAIRCFTLSELYFKMFLNHETAS